MANPRLDYTLRSRGIGLTAPDNKPIIVHLVLNIEYWPFDEPMPRTIITPPHGKRFSPDVPNFSWVDYGMRCGFPRLLKALTDRQLPVSTSFNASVIEAYPEAAEAMRDANWEFIGHGLVQRMLHHEENEEKTIKIALEKIERFTGRKVRGWLSPGLQETVNTPDILAKLGVDYVCDWVIDDLPNWLKVRSGSLLQMPYNLELNDSVIYAVENHSSDEFLKRLKSTLKVFEHEANTEPRILALGLHPHLIGVPHRFAYFEQMLDLLCAHPKVCFMTGGAITDWYRDQIAPPEADTAAR